MDANYIARALCYHGQPMQKIWEDERGVDDLRLMGIAQPDYSIYQERQKFFTFQERAKRLKMHQFLARKAIDIYDKQLVGNVMEEKVQLEGNGCIVPLAPYEFFCNMKDKTKSWQHRLSALKPGDIICATVEKESYNRLMLKPVCTEEPMHIYLADIPIKATISPDHWGPFRVDKEGNVSTFSKNEMLRCEILEICCGVKRLTLSLVNIHNKSVETKLGPCKMTDLPKYYRRILNIESAPRSEASALQYENQLIESLEFQNPNYDVLFQLNGLQPNESLSLLGYLKNGFAEEEYAAELRQKQASQWAFRSVADGIEHFKNGQQVEAFQCLNKALSIDPRNVEGLVARGALYANRGSFLKAIEDFEKALKLNKYHVNARKYMGETLVALGRSYEEDNRIPEAIKAYSDCLNLLPQHEQARQSLEALQRPQNNATLAQLYDDLWNLPGGSKGHALTPDNDDEGSSSSDSESGSDECYQPGKQRNNSVSSQFNQPFYAMGNEKSVIIDAQKANEFKLDDDETRNSVRKLLREASKHKKAKKKGKKKEKERHKDRQLKTTSEDTMELLKKLDFNEAYRLMQGASTEAELKAKLECYLGQQSMYRQKSETPPPAPPPFKKSSIDGPSTSKYAAAISNQPFGMGMYEQAPTAPKLHEQQKLSFQIKKRQFQMDKFGLVRLATPLDRLPSCSRSRSRSRSPNRRRQLSARRGFRNSRSYSRSPRSRSRRRRTRSPSRGRNSRSPPRYGGRMQRGRDSARSSNYRRDRRSRSRSFGRRRTPSPFQPRRRSPSPFVPRRSPSPFSRFRRSRSTSRSPNRQRYQQRTRGRSRGRQQTRWLGYGNRCVSRSNSHRGDERYSDDDKPQTDGPTIEEVDEMIKEAQKERKQGIIKGDKEILKKVKTAVN